MTKKEEYSLYIEKHIDMVQKVFRIADSFFTGAHFIDEDLECDLIASIKKHDQSKYSDEEFEGYRQFFYPEEGEEKSKELFTKAWDHHKSVNRHHWQFWVDKKGAIEMPLVDVIEMLCDWTAMNINFKNVPSAWYKKQDLDLHPLTREKVELFMPVFDTVYCSQTMTDI